MPTTTATTHQSALLLVPPRDDASSNHHHNTNEHDDYDDGSSLESTRCVHADDDDKPCSTNHILPQAPITPKQSKKSVRFCPDDQNCIHAMPDCVVDEDDHDRIWYSPDELSSFKRRAQRMADRIQDKTKWLPQDHEQSPHQFLSALEHLVNQCTQHQEQQQAQQEAEQEEEEDEQEQPEEEQHGDARQEQPQPQQQHEEQHEKDPFTLPPFVQPLLDRLVQWYALANPQQQEDGPSLLSMSSHDSSHASSSSPTKTSLPLECIGLEGFVSTVWSRDAAQRRRAICRVVHHITEEYELGFWTADELPAGYQTCCRRISQVPAIMAHIVALAQWQASSFDY